MLDVKIDLKELNEATTLLSAVANAIPDRALSRALNYTGNRARTQVVREVSKDTSITYGRVRDSIRTTPSTPSTKSYTLTAKGHELPLSEFGPKQTRQGASVRVWGKRTVLPHTFVVPSLNNNVFERTSRARLPIRMLWGPSIPKELVSEKVIEAFKTTAETILPQRVVDELHRELSGVIKQKK